MIYWKEIKIQIRTTVILKSVSLQLKRGESLGIIGANGCGKTILAKAIAGILPVIGTNESIPYRAVYVSFQSQFQLKHSARGYRQQRWNWTDPEFIPTVKEEFEKIETQTELKKLVIQFNFEKLIDQFVISLSNGEQRKFELIKALATSPDLLVIDNAFNGLDKASRILLNEMLNYLIVKGHSVVLTGLKPEDFPERTDRFISIATDNTCRELSKEQLPENKVTNFITTGAIPVWKNSETIELMCLKNLHLEMAGKVILKDISWTINKGECWVLSGENGSGKTSLLNMIFADNPKAYQCDIRLFGNPKGSGESIWEIKDRIGFVSPEMHQYLTGRQKVNDVICSGFFGSEGLYQKPTSFQRKLAVKWLGLIGLKHLNEKSFETLSASAQRMVLVVRTMVKNPPLIILDEPFQGLDACNIERLKNLLNTIAENTNCSMIFVSHFEEEIPSSFKFELRLHGGRIDYLGEKIH